MGMGPAEHDWTQERAVSPSSRRRLEVTGAAYRLVGRVGLLIDSLVEQDILLDEVE